MHHTSRHVTSRHVTVYSENFEQHEKTEFVSPLNFEGVVFLRLPLADTVSRKHLNTFLCPKSLHLTHVFLDNKYCIAR